MKSSTSSRAAFAVAVVIASGSALAGPFASTSVEYVMGTGVSPDYSNPSGALGSATRFTGVQYGFPSVVSPFSPPFDPGDFVSVGKGGHLTLAFDHNIYNRASNAYGFDFLLFGNWFYAESGGLASARFGMTGGSIQVSQDGADWRSVSVSPGSGYATLGYSDLTDPYSTTPGSVPTDFTKPVDPSFNPIGKTFAEIVAGYNGSGGGTGVDIASTGLEWIRYVRISNPDTNSSILHIDALAEVPAPASLISLLVVCAAPRRRSR